MIRAGLIFILLFYCFSNNIFSQNSIRIDTSLSVDDLIRNKFLHGGVEMTNIKFSGDTKAIGLFTCTSDSFPLSKGILLTTGRANQAVGPNNSFGMSGVNKTPGDISLDAICKDKTFDAAVIEFDFIPSSENIAFDFVFASEEYPEFVNTEFNDVFAFIVTRLDTKEEFNIAYLPKTYEPITVNTVNHLKNAKFYIDNPAAGPYYFKDGTLQMFAPALYESEGKKQQKADMANIITTKCKTGLCKMIQYDGFTRVLTAKSKVVPDKLYHFKIAIADVHDDIYDSGVILRARSFVSYNKYGIIKGDTTGFIVQDENLEKFIPKKPKENIQEKPKIASISASVFFDFDSALLTVQALQTLDSLSKILIKNPRSSIRLYAHTDSFGTNNYNNLLSLKRGKAVEAQLKKLGVLPGQIKMEYFGEEKPKATNDTESGRSLNRRVELLIQEQNGK